MRKISVLFIFLFALFSASTVFAEFKNVEKAFCDGEELSLSEGQRVFISLQKSLFGMGEIQNISGKKCRVVDFFSILITSHTSVNGNKMITFEPVQEVGRRSSCEPGTIPFEGISFDTASYTEGKMTLKNTENCEILEYILSVE